MFTGIIRHIGKIEKITPLGKAEQAGLELTIVAGAMDMSQVAIGDSIAVQGACMTVIEKHAHSFVIQVSRESLDKTVGLDCMIDVNLETAMKLGDTFDGHIVSGHVDGIGEIIALEPVGESHELRIQVPKELARCMAYKGSVTVNGVSLTINQVKDNASGCEISINLIPHTMLHTTFQYNKVGDSVNLEVDMLARYVARYAERFQETITGY